MALVSLPFLAVEFVPSTDLPQHMGQLRLFGEALSDPSDALSIQWWTPYGLVYAVLALPWAVLAPVAAGRLGVWLLVVLEVAAVHLLAARWQRPVAGAVLATPFVFHAQLYWGFLNFVFGFPLFVAWYLLSRRSSESEQRQPWRTAGLFLLMAGLLYFAHALWFACALLWLGVEALISRRPWKQLAWRVLGVAPVAAAALYWFAFLRSGEFATPPEWANGLGTRLHPLVFAQTALGGLRHGVELLVVLVVLLWVLAAVLSRRGERLRGCDPYLLSLAALFLGLYLLLPDKFSQTIRFSARWLPWFVISLALAVGSPPMRRVLRRTLAVVVLTLYMLVTTVYWRAFETAELAGLAESLAAIEGEPRVVGLSYTEASRYVRGRPFVQVFSWAYAVHGGVLNFSFGDTPMSLVVYDDASRFEWTVGLEWLPKAVRRSDFQYFDYALVGGDAPTHRAMMRLPELKPVTTGGVWRLYRIESTADASLASLSAPAVASPGSVR